MIVYDLYCDQGHVFEGWFDDSGDYQSQKARGLISCPICDSNIIEIRLPAVGLRRATAYQAQQGDAPRETGSAESLARLQEYINANFEDVGKDFASRVLKMHYGVEEPRNVRGTSSPEDEKRLESEGVPFLKLPMPQKPGGKQN